MKSTVTAHPVLIFGGTFDPPHLGHEEVLLDVIKQLGFEKNRPKKIWITPSFQPNLKITQTDFQNRYEMSKILMMQVQALQPDLEISVQTIERELRFQCTFDLLLHLRQNNLAPTFVMGSDQFTQWPKWQHFPEVVSLAHWVIWKRKFTETQPEHEAAITAIEKQGRNEGWISDQNIRWLTTSARAVSSHEIRAAFATRNMNYIKENLSADLFQYIERNKLYGIQ